MGKRSPSEDHPEREEYLQYMANRKFMKGKETKRWNSTKNLRNLANPFSLTPIIVAIRDRESLFSPNAYGYSLEQDEQRLDEYCWKVAHSTVNYKYSHNELAADQPKAQTAEHARILLLRGIKSRNFLPKVVQPNPANQPDAPAMDT